MELKEIVTEAQNKKNLPNKRLIEMMHLLSQEHEETKKHLINITHYFDKIEETYNSLLEEFETRKNGS